MMKKDSVLKNKNSLLDFTDKSYYSLAIFESDSQNIHVNFK